MQKVGRVSAMCTSSSVSLRPSSHWPSQTISGQA
uniref:Uncharacterized protein n=1 Tax=Anguilla anguilla TaxID=7936 RepID=A0A0E9UWD3_ANGAN